MKTYRKHDLISLLLICLLTLNASVINSQQLTNPEFSTRKGLIVEKLILSDSSTSFLKEGKPVISFLLNNKLYTTAEINPVSKDSIYLQNFGNNLMVTFKTYEDASSGWKCDIIFENSGKDTVSISNVVPFGENNSSVYITGSGPWDLARAWLFRPGYQPVRVILPDNAWDLGYSSFSIDSSRSVCALARRIKTDGGQRKRYETILPPKSKVTYAIHAEVFEGEWQNGLRLMFQRQVFI